MNTFIDTILNKDVWTIIDDYKTITEQFELQQEVTKKMREQLFRINKIIIENEEIRGDQIVNLNYGEYLIEWIEDEKQQQEFDDNFEIELDYGLDEELDEQEYIELRYESDIDYYDLDLDY